MQIEGFTSLRRLRERVAEWGIKPDRIGMIRFSAGAFFGGRRCHGPRGAPLAFVAPIYGGETQGRRVPANAPPLFTAVARDDRMFFRVVEGLYSDRSSADRAAGLHTFSRGEHGFGVARRGLPVDRWTGLLEDWLVNEGFVQVSRHGHSLRLKQSLALAPVGVRPALHARRGVAHAESAGQFVTS